MSRIYFHSEHGDAELRGSERAYMGCLCNDLMIAVIGDLPDAREWLVPLLPADSYARREYGSGLESTLALFLRGMGSTLIVDGKPVETWLISLNTAMALGGSPLKLFARLHGQCEVHCWVDGANRKWLAGIIRAGRQTNLYRDSQGWEAVADLLESRDDSPVVCSYSVCEQFPNFGCLPDDHPLMAMGDDDAAREAFYELPDAEAWEACMAGLRAIDGRLELRPDGWDEYFFGSGHSAFNLPHTPTVRHPLDTAALTDSPVT